MFLILALLLLYYYSFYVSSTRPLPQPQAAHDARTQPAPQFVSQQPTQFAFLDAQGAPLWEVTLPDSVQFHGGTVKAVDACHATPDGGHVVATGQALYDYLKNHPAHPATRPTGSGGPVLQQGHVFYFACQGRRVEALHVCPSGQVFLRGACRPISRCHGQPDGTLLPVPGEAFRFLSCQDQQAVPIACPAGTFFQFNACRLQDDLLHYCRFQQAPMLLDVTTRVTCVAGKPRFQTCPPRMQWFGDRCEPSDCVGRPDGTRLALDHQHDHAQQFRYAPGYYECQKERVGSPVSCPSAWDTYRSSGEDLLHLPMVFDGRECAVPAMCDNVMPIDRNLVAPAYYYRKHVANWDHAERYDMLGGYQCVRGKRKWIDVNAGKAIKRYKIQDACDGTAAHIPVPGEPTRYFDCATGRVSPCPGQQQFFGTACRQPPDHAFQFGNLSFFRMSPLTDEPWIVPWFYAPPQPDPVCPDGTVFLPGYRVCSHPDCTPYPFLKQLPDLFVLLPGHPPSKCVWDGQVLLKKEPVAYPYDFWTQRRLPDEPGVTADEPCVPGTHWQSGHLVWDSVLFRTCDLQQPFVFCPAEGSGSLVHVQNKRWACTPPPDTVTLDVLSQWVNFPKNELKALHNVGVALTSVTLKRNRQQTQETIPADGLVFEKDETVSLLLTQPIRIEYRSRITHPSDVAWRDGRLLVASHREYGFLTARQDFTSKELDYPVYSVETAAPDFDSKIKE